MRVVVNVRRTEAWDRWGLEEYANSFHYRYPNVSAECREMFLNNIRLWEENYEPGFFKFRQIISDIALKNWRRLGVDIILSDPSCNMFEDKLRVNKNMILLPTDDDDWFNPAVVPLVVKAFEENPHLECVYWDNYQYQCCDVSERYHIYRGHKCGTNGYALRGGYPWWYYGCHDEMNGFDSAKMMKLKEKCLSVYVNHPASFWKNMHYRFTDSKLERVKRPKVFDWAAGEIEAAFSAVMSLHRIRPLTEQEAAWLVPDDIERPEYHDSTEVPADPE